MIDLTPYTDANGDIDLKKELIQNLAGIVTSGSNENGSYIKFDDGTMVCYGSKGFTSVTPTLASAPLYYYSATFNNFAQTFISAPIVIPSVYSATDNRVVSCATGFGPTNTNPYGGNPLRVYLLGAAVITFSISYIAIGKWK